LLLAEKRSLIQFVSVFVGLNTIFLITLSVLYYNYQKNIFTEILKNEIINYTETAYESIYDINNIQKVEEYLLHDSRFEIALTDKQYNIIYSSSNDFNIKFQKGFFIEKEYFYYIKTIELAQIKKVHYLVIRANTINAELSKTKNSIYMVLLFSISFFSLMIYILSKLFLRPLRQYIELLDNFIRDATHELNTPISVISMSLERINKSEFSPRNIKSLQHIQVAARTLSHLYNDLTFLIFPSKSHLETKIRVDELILQRIDYFLPLADVKKIKFITNLEFCEIIINESIISRIIDNILSNAIKYNKRNGEIKIVLNKYSLIVSDTGIGFDTAFSKEIFKRYTRLESSSGGFGLGLSIVKSLCDLYEISINVESQKNIGTTFTFLWKSSRIIHTS
jgi:two-component system OmpR family sensor kinase